MFKTTKKAALVTPQSAMPGCIWSGQTPPIHTSMELLVAALYVSRAQVKISTEVLVRNTEGTAASRRWSVDG